VDVPAGSRVKDNRRGNKVPTRLLTPRGRQILERVSALSEHIDIHVHVVFLLLHGEFCTPYRQDIFGSNMLAVGGFCGGADAMGGAVEHQHDGNPHFHVHIHIVNMYQHGSLADISTAIRTGLLDPETIYSYHMKICNEEHPILERHTSQIEELHASWPQYKDRSHHALSQLPRYVHRDHSRPGLWGVDASQFASVYEGLQEEAHRWAQEFHSDVQFVLSRTNHHHHKRTPKGMVPLSACRAKGKKKSNVAHSSSMCSLCSVGYFTRNM